MSDKICVLIHSKNRPENETVSDFNIKIPDALSRLHNTQEYWNVNVNYFSCFNSWYNCQGFRVCTLCLSLARACARAPTPGTLNA